MDLISIIQYPFMQRALLAAIIVAFTCGLVGVLIVLRGAALYGDAIAHTSLAGVATALLLGFNPMLGALIYAVLIAVFLSLATVKTSYKLDQMLAVVLPISMALAVTLLAFVPGYRPELVSYLFGSILRVSWSYLWLSAGLSILVIATLLYKYRYFLLSFTDPDQAKIVGVPADKYELIYNILLAVTVIISIRIIGVVLVTALLVLPVLIVRPWAKSMRQLFWLTPVISLTAALIGVLASFYWNLPTGPSITLVIGGFFVFGILGRKYAN